MKPWVFFNPNHVAQRYQYSQPFLVDLTNLYKTVALP